MDPTLASATVIAIGWALSYRAKWKRAERKAADYHRWWHAWCEDATKYWRQLEATRSELVQAQAALADTERKWLDMKRRYLDSLDEIAALRDGSAAE